MKYLKLIILLIIKIHFFGQITPSFTADNVSGCAPLVVNFTNTSTNAISYSWDFDNGTTSILNNPSATYTNPGFYTIKLIAFNGPNSDSIILVDYIHVLDKPNSSFSYNVLEDCEDNNLINFSNNSIGGITYLWDFGNGDTSLLENPSYSYSFAGNFPVTLVVENGLGCIDDSTINSISIYPTPIINATSDTLLICDSSYNFTFSGTSTNTTIASWDWSFGDGNTISSNLQSTSYSYLNSGTFNPSVIATSTDGCKDSVNLNTINIETKPYYTLTSDINQGCPPLSVNFSILPNNNISTVVWNFDDGNIINAGAVSNNIYLNNGVFNPNASIESTNGCIQQISILNAVNVSNGPSASFNMTNISGCPPLDVQFDITTQTSNTLNIDFGDGNNSNSSNINHTYIDNGRYYPSVTITDTNNCQNLINLDTILSGISNIDFTASNTEGCASLKVDFVSLAADAVNFYWDFGDSTSSTDPNPEHIYDSIGLYTVRLVANDINSCFDTLIKTDFINVIKDEIEVYSVDTIKACSPYTFNTDVYNIGVNFWNWDFGDGILDSGSNINHLYSESGNYNVSLLTDAPNGCQYDLLNFAYLIIDSIETDVNLNLNTDCSIGSVNILNNSSGTIQHQWNMGDGSVYYTPNVQHTYNTSQSYVITYESVSTIGCHTSQYYSVIFDCNNDNPVVIPMPSQNPINVLTDPSNGTALNQTCGPQSVNLSSPFLSAFSWSWDFGDGQTSTLQNPNHYYANSGTYNLKHIGYNFDGSSDTIIINNFINQYDLNANFSLTKNEYCNYNSYHFNNNNSGITSWEWKLDTNTISNISNDSITLQLNDSVSVLSLKIADQFGCIAESEQNIFLYHPLAIIEQDTFACNGSNLIFSCCVKEDPIHYWDLDDGGNYTPDTAIVHQYQQTGWFTPILTLDNPGCIRQVVLDSIEIYEPDASFSPFFQNPICKTDSLFFTANNTEYSSYSWTGGSVSSTNDSVWIQLNESGLKVISLSTTNKGCSNSFNSDTILVNEASANFSYSLLNNCIPIDVVFQDLSINPVNWEWELDNIWTSVLSNPSQQFSNFPTDSIKLTITDINGCKDSINKPIVNNFNAEFMVSDTLTCSGTTLTFSPISEVVNTWIWDFGDGNTSTDSVPSHSYQNPGLYNIQLIASDGQGCTDTANKFNYIDVKQVIADFNYVTTGNCPPVTTTFTDLSSGANNYNWDFGDNLNSVIQNPGHVYTNSGYYDVSLVASDNFGCSDTLSINNLIYIPGPILNFTIDQSFGCDSLSISISDSSTNTANYLYNFGDGATSTLSSPNHLYNTAGSFQVTLVGEDAAGCQLSITSPNIITVDVSPIIDVILSDSNICLNATISVINNSIYNQSNLWTFGSDTYNIAAPNISANLVDSNNLTYIAGNFNATCFDTSVIEVITHDIPDVSIINPGILCENQGLLQLTSTNDSIFNILTWTGSAIVNSSIGIIDPGLIIDSTVVYLQNDSICPSYDSLTIFVKQPDDPSILSNDTVYCEGSLLQTPIVLNSGGYWYGANIDSITGIIQGPLNQGSYSYLYVLNNADNCKDSAVLQIQILSNNDATILNPGVICDNIGTLNLISLNSGGVWSGPNINSMTGSIDVNSLGFGNFEFNYSIPGTCPDQDTLNLDIYEFIQAQINPSNDFCEGLDSILFSSNTNIGYWSGLYTSDSTSGWFLTDSVQDGVYEIYYNIYGNCPDSDSITITILPKPEIALNFGTNTTCLGSQLSFINSSPNIASEDFSWYVNDSLYYLNFNEPYFILDTGFYEIKVIASNQLNCLTEYTFPNLFPVYDTTALPKANVIRSTVIENQNIYTEWNSNSDYLNPLFEHHIYRSENGDNFEFIATTDSSTKSYIDENVNIQNTQYDYIIINKNICESYSMNSNAGNSVLLNYQRLDNFRTKINWNFYEGWSVLPNKYEVQKLNSNGVWESFLDIDNSKNQIIINE